VNYTEYVGSDVWKMKNALKNLIVKDSGKENFCHALA
jgi:hypothetical protein